MQRVYILFVICLQLRHNQQSVYQVLQTGQLQYMQAMSFGTRPRFWDESYRDQFPNYQFIAQFSVSHAIIVKSKHGISLKINIFVHRRLVCIVVKFLLLQNNIPVFSPGLTDGSIGDMLYYHSYKNPGLVIDIVEGKCQCIVNAHIMYMDLCS